MSRTTTATAPRPAATPADKPTAPLRALSLADARALADALEAEAEALPGKIREASAWGDADDLLKLRARFDELPLARKSAQVLVLRANIAHLKARVEQQAPELLRAREKQHEAEKALEEARAAHNAALAAASNLQSALNFDRSDLAAAERELQDLTAELSHRPGNVVRFRAGEKGTDGWGATA